MTDNTTLDAAIEAAQEARIEQVKSGEYVDTRCLNRTYFRAGIAHLFANLEPPEGATCYEVDLFNDAKRALLKASGLGDLA
jgi:hypothetical protein